MQGNSHKVQAGACDASAKQVNSPWNEPYKMIGRGKAGWHAQSNTVSSSGGTLEGYVSQAEDGCLVYDADEADYNTYAELVIKGPMCKVSLGAEEIDTFKDHAKLLKMLPALGGAHQGIALAALVGVSSMDYIGLGIYERLLRGVPGMKMGRVRNGYVVWEPADLREKLIDGAIMTCMSEIAKIKGTP